MAAKKPANSAPVSAPATLVLPQQNDPSKLAPSEVGQPLPDSPLAVEVDTALSLPISVRQPILRFVTFEQILVDGKLAGPADALMAKRPELIPHIVALLKARETKTQTYQQALQATREREIMTAHSAALDALRAEHNADLQTLRTEHAAALSRHTEELRSELTPAAKSVSTLP